MNFDRVHSVNAFCRIDCLNLVARCKLAVTTDSNSSTTLNRRSTSATIRACSAMECGSESQPAAWRFGTTNFLHVSASVDIGNLIPN
jgi:hypothetical protein